MTFRKVQRDVRNDVRNTSRGFTLVELLVVILIIVLLSTLITFSPSVLRSENISGAANMVMEDLAFAREYSISSNQQTEVWFLKPTTGTALHFNALRIYTVDENGLSSPYGPVHHLPTSVIADSGSTTGTSLSTLFAGTTYQKPLPTPPPPIPGYQSNYKAWYVRFNPDGSTTATANLYVTMHDVSLTDPWTTAPTTLPKNYALVSIDHVTGAVNLYRP
jgi:uncharacterized protein (TIGR02596 family)